MTEKDLYYMLHTKPLPYGSLEMGIYIFNVSHFTKKKYHVEKETNHREEKVYVVDNTVNIPPRLMYRIYCSLNDNMELMDFSCI